MSSVILAGSISIPGLSHSEQSTLNALYRQYLARLPRNRIRAMYYDSKNLIKDLGIAIPPNLVNLDMVLGWPAKAVDGLSRRNKMDGFVIPGDSSADLGIDAMWSANNMDIEAPQAHTSTYVHSCAFVAVTAGDVQSGEPSVLITTQSAMSGTALWDPRRRGLAAALSIVEADEWGSPLEVVMYLPDATVIMSRVGSVWSVDRRKHTLSRVPVELLRYSPRLERPFGCSRISRPVMSLADSALRTAVRMEVSAEFYSAPQRWIMGADESAFMDSEGNLKSQWQALMGRVWAAGRDEDGNVPVVGEFNASSQQPNIEHMRALATQFAGETSIPVGSLGVVQDNPSSAEAIYAAKEDLLIEAEYCNEVFGATWVRAMLTGLQLRDNLDAIPDEWRRLRTKWRDPATPSRSSAADAVVKIVTAFPWLGESEVALEQLGWDETTVARAMADKRKAGLSAFLQSRPVAPADPAAAALAAQRTEAQAAALEAE